MIRITYRKLRGDLAGFYALVTRDGRAVWSCEHDHTSRKRALACGRRWVKLGAGAVPLTSFGAPAKPWSGKRPHVLSSQVGSAGKPEIRRSLMERLVACAVSESDNGENAAFGILIHDCIYEYLLACVSAGQESRWSVLPQIVTNQFYRVPRGIGPERLDEAMELLERFTHTHTADLHTLMHLQTYEPSTRNVGALWVSDSIPKPALEYTMKLDVGWAVITGTVDRLDRVDGDDRDDPPRIVQATDYKSQWAVSPHLFQGRTYAALAFAQPWAYALQEFWWMPDPFKLKRDPMDGVIVYQRGDLDEWWEHTLAGVRQRWDLRISGRATPTGGVACQYCALRYGCSAALPVAKGIPENVDQAEELIGEWVRLEESVKLRKASLATYFNEHAPIQVGGLEVGWLSPREEQWRGSDPIGIVNHLNAQGLDGASVLFTAVNPKLVPSVLKDQLVVAGVARYERGPRTFKRRKAGAAGDEDGER